MFESLLKHKKTIFQNASFDLGTERISIPVFQKHGNQPGKSILILGGMDGDEYTGIEACYQLAEKYKDGSFSGTLTIIPIVNLPGFKAEMSKNPLDGKFPKYVFPGKIDGTASERLIYHLIDTYAKNLDVWIELHSGAITERITPLIWLVESRVTEIEALNQKIIKTVKDAVIVYEYKANYLMTDKLSKIKCSRIILESGGRGELNRNEIETLINWSETIIRSSESIEIDKNQKEISTIVRDIKYIKAPCNGIFYCKIFNPFVKKGSLLGTCYTFDKSYKKDIFAPINGIILYNKETMSLRTGDTIFALGKI